MNRSDDASKLDRQISVLSDLIAQYQTRIKQMNSDGRNTDGALSALDALGEVYRRRLIQRLDLRNAATNGHQRRASR